jgi:uncharacterized protein YdcH (DUF465 family)
MGNLLFWGLIALALLLLALGMFQLARPHYNREGKRATRRFAGFMTILSGLLLGAFGLFAWIPTMAGYGEMKSKWAGFASREKKLTADYSLLSGQISGLKAENARLKGMLESNQANNDEIARLKGVVARLTKTNGELDKENVRLRGLASSNNANDGEIMRLKGVIARMSKDNDEIKTENTRLKGLLSNKSANGDEINRLNGVIARLNNSNRQKDTEISSLKAALLKARKRPATAAAPESPLSLMHSARLKSTGLRLEGGNYDIVEDKNDEIVKGRKGHYYRIRLKNPASGKNYRFASGSYYQVQPQAAFKKSLDEAMANIKDALDGRRNYELFVRGKASGGRFNGKLDPNHDYSRIMVLPKPEGAKSYDNIPVERTYGPKITNDDLPNLRAAFLQDYIAKNYNMKKPTIVDGKVSKSKDASKQAVSVMLFVED